MANKFPILINKFYDRPSVFRPDNLLREARRQKGVLAGNVPEICVLDPDGDFLHYVRNSADGIRDPYWACYHTDLYDFHINGSPVGVLGCAVGASFAVLVAEELFASGCRFLISITSAGQIVSVRRPPYFILIERALRDEGTSYHYLPPESYVEIQSDVCSMLSSLIQDDSSIVRGSVWTTDAPFRETEEAIAFARSEGLLAVDMEAAALYAFARASRNPIVCFAYVTNQMGMIESDFEKGLENGSAVLMDLVSRVVREWRHLGTQNHNRS
jgi:uridine phosphorylase